MTIEDRGYKHPEVLVSTEWVASNLKNRQVRIVESNEDPLLYVAGHIPGAVNIDWTRDLNDPVRRDYLERAAFERLMSRSGITPETTVVFYGDKNNWWACYAFWVFQLFGHKRARVMDGGRLKWQQEERALVRDTPRYPESSYRAPDRDDGSERIFRDELLRFLKDGQLVDVRSREEFTGERLHMPEYPNEGALRGGHIPGAQHIPWAMAVNSGDGTFKSAEELRRIYLEQHRLDPQREVVAYCRIGERSSLTWFTLKFLLGFSRVRNYDGSWTEWGNLVGVPVAKGVE